MKTKVSQLGVAVVGLGVGEQHARAYKADQACRLLWLCDRDAAKSKKLAAELGVGRTAADFGEVLADPAVQVISIASFDDDHFTHAEAALRAGKHVFVEKPLCRSRRELASLRAAWEAGGRPQLASNLVLRAAPLYERLGALIAGGRLGELYAFDGDYLYGRLEKITSGWRKDVPGYSVLQGGAIHLIDLMLGLTGQKPAAVEAAGNSISTRGTAFRYPDFAAATYRFPSGLIGRITANFGCVHRHQHVVRVFGTKGTFLADDQGARLYTSRESGAPAKFLDLAAVAPSKGALIPSFVQDILAESDPEPRFRRECDVIAACVAADEALSRSRSIKVEYL